MRRPRPRRRRRPVLSIAALLLVGLSAVSMLGFTAANVVPPTRAGEMSKARAVGELAPPECAGVGLATVVVGTTGGPGNDLVLGGPGGQTMRGEGGDDCVVGGGGDDTFIDLGGVDVCIGGPGNDTNGFLGLFLRCDVFVQ